MNDFDKLEAWSKMLRDAENVLELVSVSAAGEIVGLVQEGFRTETDPYGKPWAPKKRADGRKVLSGQTSALKNGWHVVRAERGGFTIAPSVDYATYHQAPGKGPGGRSRRPKRMMVPAGGRLPRKWRDAIEQVAIDTLKHYFETGAASHRSGKSGRTRSGAHASIVKKIARHARGQLQVRAIVRRVLRAALR